MRIEKLKYLDETDKKILELITQGKTYKQISFTVGLKFHAIDYRVKQIRKMYNCPSTPALIAKLVETDVI